ncbi:SUKH-4 family immunity protein [Streptomyces hesseae]|uniref:SUKH-4 family immunity protein n=1 Tax=Streptomyces hesseae TaxID=3075519 RepID=A0ABU2SKW2_9ACTN|nr:SUKH-4 family immunity protein [Streptomyces sp. DSM 40473]MDT0448685.1 SUKH-4 family immunity protein [Streptomyces sp. DSM 40473]
MVTFAQAQERAERWVNGDVPAYLQREVKVREFDLGFVCWAEDREDGPRGDGGRVRLVIARDSGETTLWPALPVGEVIRRYEEEYGTVEEQPAGGTGDAAPRRLDLEATSFLLSPPQWLQDAADAMGIPDRRSGSSQAPEPASASARPEAEPEPVPEPEPERAPEPAAAPVLVKEPASEPAPAPAAAAEAWAGADVRPDDDDDDFSVGLPATVLAPALSGSDFDDTPPPSTRPEAKTELLPQGSALPRTSIAPAIDGLDAPGMPPALGVPGAPGVPPAPVPGAPGQSGVPPVPGAAPGVPGAQAPGVPPVPGAPGQPGMPPAPTAGQPGAPQAAPGFPGQAGVPPVPAPGAPGQAPGAHGPGGPGPSGMPSAPGADAAGAPQGPGAAGRPGMPPAPGAPSAPQGPGAPGPSGMPPIPGAPGVPGRPGMPPAPGAPQAPGTPGQPGMPPAPGAPGVPGADPAGAPQGPGGGAHAAATMLASPGGPVPPAPPGVPGAPAQPGAPQGPGGVAHAATMLASPGTPGMPGAPGAPAVPPQAPGRPGAAQPPGGGVHAAATMLAGPGTPGLPGAAPQPPQAPAPGAAPAYGYPQAAPTGLPTVGPGYMAVLRYRAQDGSEQQIIRRSAPGTPHPEWQILHELRAMNVPPQQVLELHTELESCDLPGGYCARMVRETWPQVRVSHTAPYGRDHATRQQGMRHLVAHQGELHQVADGPARPAPNPVPLPHPGAIQPAPPVGPDVIGRELAEAFGPQGVFRFDQRAVSRQGVPEVVAQTLVWAGLPADFGPFFWAQAQPGRPVPTLAELAAERGVRPAADAGSYLVMGGDFGRQLCVQYGMAHIVAVPLEAGPDGHPVPPQFVNTSLPQFVRSLALLGKMWRWRYGLTPEQAGRWTVDFQEQLAALDPAALSTPENWWAVLLEQMWDGLF